MRRIFTNFEAQQTYDTLLQVHPARTAPVIGNAFYFGYENPYNEGLPDLCGKPGGIARAAWAAGVDSRRQQSRVINKIAFPSGELATRHG